MKIEEKVGERKISEETRAPFLFFPLRADPLKEESKIFFICSARLARRAGREKERIKKNDPLR